MSDNHVTCSRCGKSVSNAIEVVGGGAFVIRAFVECPECIETVKNELDEARSQLAYQTRLAEERLNVITLSKILTDKMSEKVTELEGQMFSICTLISLVTMQFIGVMDELSRRSGPDMQEQLAATKDTMVASMNKLTGYLKRHESNNTEGTTPS